MAAEMEQGVRREETATKLKLMDLGLEKDRNDIALGAQKMKHDADTMRVRGVSRIASYVGDATANKKLLDSETQAGYWRMMAEEAPFVDRETGNSIWDNTFGKAMDWEARASGRGADSPANIQEFNKDLELQNQIESESDPVKKKKLEETLDLYRQYTGSTKRQSGAPVLGEDFGTTTDEKGNHFTWFRKGKSGDVSYRAIPSGLNNLQSMQYNTRARLISKQLADDSFSDSDKLDAKEPASITAERKLDALDREFGSLAGRPSPSSAPSTGTRESPHKPATPEEAKKYKSGEWIMSPDGRLIQLK